MKVLNKQDIQKLITMSDAIDAMASAFSQLSDQAVTLPLRTQIQIPQQDATSLFMPAYLHKDKQLGIKIVSVFPNNAARDIPSINGIIVLLDGDTGEVSAVLDAGYITALRTGAASGLATKLFARDDAKHVAIIGSGVQAHTQLEAVALVRDIQTVTVWSRNNDNAQTFAQAWQGSFNITACKDIRSAVQHADIICTATNSTEALIHLADIKPNAHINAIGSHSKKMHEIANDVIANSTVVVDQIDAALSEAGEIHSAIEANMLDVNALVEIGSYVNADTSELKNKPTLFKSVGLAIQDISVAQSCLGFDQK